MVHLIMSTNNPLLIATIVALFGLILAEPVELDIESYIKTENAEIPEAFDYANYVAKYNKNYNPIETVNRARLFFGRTLNIFKHNIQYASRKVDYYLRQNEFTDMEPQKLKKFDEFSDLKPVVGADKYPDMPADKAMSLSSTIDIESDSSASLKEYEKESPVESGLDREKLELIASFDDLSNKIDNVDDLIKAIKAEPQTANKIASIVDLNTISKDKMTEDRIDKIRKKKDILYKPVVESNNQNYDLQLVPSFGDLKSARGEDNLYGNKYAQFLMDGIDFEFYLKPYPVVKPPEDLNKAVPLTLSNLFGSVVSIFDTLSDEYEDVDEDEGGHRREADYVFIEPPRIAKIGEKGAVTKNEAAKASIATEKAKKAEVAAESSRNAEMKIPKLDQRKSVIKYSVDWRSSGCITEPQSQMKCDSCYAFTVLSLMEFFHCRQTKKLTDFSPQYVVDCGTKSELRGCRGGKISNVGKFIKEYGIELNSMYPYIGKENECPYDSKVDEQKQNGYLRPEIIRWHAFREMAAWYKWLPRSPLIVGINMPGNFHAYGGGIHDGFDCNPAMTHAMLLVGMGEEDGKKFWLMKNSYSNSWGENGYFRLSQSAPLRCFDSAFVVRVKFD